MKIVHVITRTDAGGAQMVAALLANEFVARGYCVTLLGGCEDGTMWKWVNNEVNCIHCPTLKREISPIDDIKTFFFLRKVYKEVNPDIVHLHSSKAGFIGRLALPKCKTVYTLHGFDHIGIGRILIEYMMRGLCSAIIGVCRNDMKNLLRLGIKNNVSYIYNGIREPVGSKPIHWEVPDTFRKYILCIARLVPQKDHQLFLEVAGLLPEYAFVWIGNARPVTVHPENVFFMGVLPDAGSYCQLCDLFCLTSHYEGLPIAIIEAMSYGKPIVSSDVGGVQEIVRDGINGYALPNDAKVFAEKIKYILDNQSVHDTMGNNSKIIFEEELTLERMADSYQRVYQRISNG